MKMELTNEEELEKRLKLFEILLQTQNDLKRKESSRRKIGRSLKHFQEKRDPRIIRESMKMIFSGTSRTHGRKMSLDQRRKTKRNMKVERNIKIRRERNLNQKVVVNQIVRSLVQVKGQVAEKRKSLKIRKTKGRIKIKMMKMIKANQKIRKIQK